ncbi:MAG: hypothetical protein HJJLKODD_02277 [Phycisphaerae bacterium]|nr:hypothetical protein [Phycisphaerae bacterium]
MTPTGQHHPDETVHYEAPRKKRAKEEASMSVNLTPAIDITFNLLIFFVVGTTFAKVEGLLPSALPSVEGVVQATPLPVSPIKIRLKQVGDGPGDYQLRIDQWRQPPESFEELTVILEDFLNKPGFNRDTPVIIYAEKKVRWNHVVNCFNAIRRVRWSLPGEEGFKNISFAIGTL